MTITNIPTWQLRELAVAADQIRDGLPGRYVADRNYAQGVADTLRFLVGDLTPVKHDRLEQINTRYLDNQDDEADEAEDTGNNGDSRPAIDYIDHRIHVDESTDAHGGDMWKAFCTDACGWSGERWHHADEYDGIDAGEAGLIPPGDQAHDAAQAEGLAHIAEMGN
jgi:hypothetical protein